MALDSGALEKKLQVTFKNKKLLELAISHRSIGKLNNERLEFLGDSVINFVIADVIYDLYPNAEEGDLSRLRSALVKRDTLGKLAEEFELGHYLKLGPGELKNGGHLRASILSCAMEAIIGAVYLDTDFDTVKKHILRWYRSRLDALLSGESHKDPKTKLQEYLQSRHLSLPIYTVQKVGGKAHAQTFTVHCAIKNTEKVAVGQGTNRRRAEQAAAQAMCDILKL